MRASVTSSPSSCAINSAIDVVRGSGTNWLIRALGLLHPSFATDCS
jgi:hypothetical protein